MAIERESFGFMPDGTEIFEYILSNGNEYEAHILTLGATLRSFYAEDKNGEMRDVLLGFDTVEEYLEKSDYQGSTVGPVCNRISKAGFEVGDKHYDLTVNEGEDKCLHSCGEMCFAPWKALVVDADEIEMSFVSPDGKNGFPGETKATVRFKLTDNNELKISYDAVSDRDTWLNFTNHAYFNLNGFDSGDTLSHTLQISASAFTAVDAESIPTGENLPVEGTPMDFTEAKEIGKDIEADYQQLKFTGGFDHNFCIDGYDEKLRQFAKAAGNESGITLTCFTTLPGVQFYAGNFLSGKTGKDGKPMKKRSGFCLETQFYPDTMHNPSFPQCLYKAGEHYVSETVYVFGK